MENFEISADSRLVYGKEVLAGAIGEVTRDNCCQSARETVNYSTTHSPRMASIWSVMGSRALMCKEESPLLFIAGYTKPSKGSGPFSNEEYIIKQSWMQANWVGAECPEYLWSVSGSASEKQTHGS